MDRLRELEILSQADRYVTSEMALMEQIAAFGKLRVDGPETAVAERTLRAFANSLTALKQHRELIVHMVRQLDRSLI